MMPMKGTPTYMQNPKAVTVPMTAEMTPTSPSRGFDLTQSAIMHVTTQKMIMRPTLKLKNGMAELVFFSSSTSRVRLEIQSTFRSASWGTVTPMICWNVSSQFRPL